MQFRNASSIGSRGDALKYCENRRIIDPPLYNQRRLNERPYPVTRPKITEPPKRTVTHKTKPPKRIEQPKRRNDIEIPAVIEMATPPIPPIPPIAKKDVSAEHFCSENTRFNSYFPIS